MSNHREKDLRASTASVLVAAVQGTAVVRAVRKTVAKAVARVAAEAVALPLRLS